PRCGRRRSRTVLDRDGRDAVDGEAAALGDGGSSTWAQGGLAAAVGPDDTPDLHFLDTLSAGAGLVDEPAARVLVDEAEARVEDLLRLGVPFDRMSDGRLKTGREAAHARERVVHATGDRAGVAIMETLIGAVRAAEHVTVRERIVVEDVVLDAEGRIAGLLAVDIDAGERIVIETERAVLATGGLGGLYAVTTNPRRAQGHGLAVAARAGAEVTDAEFVQFHPTALNLDIDPAPLATEALRGAGAVLVDRSGARFMKAAHPMAELAPRDVVARAVEAELASGNGAFLDARSAVGSAFPSAFPTVFEAAMAAGVDPRTELLPVAPAAHYHMGGLRTDLYGRSSVEGLYAVGEIASTGAHGANRLASNSLTEALVWGARAAQAASEQRGWKAGAATPFEDRLATAPKPAADAHMRILRASMSSGCALLRSVEGLNAALADIEKMKAANDMTSGLMNALLAAELIVRFALAREESRGSHFRTDFPEARDAGRRHLVGVYDRAEGLRL
ncbi:MAG: L-aspartate oxidase, partial [Pseudomonadota bacterium]